MLSRNPNIFAQPWSTPTGLFFVFFIHKIFICRTEVWMRAIKTLSYSQYDFILLIFLTDMSHADLASLSLWPVAEARVYFSYRPSYHFMQNVCLAGLNSQQLLNNSLFIKYKPATLWIKATYHGNCLFADK